MEAEAWAGARGACSVGGPVSNVEGGGPLRRRESNAKSHLFPFSFSLNLERVS
jgi:hypothetical protein